MTPEEKQHIEQRSFGITIAQVAQLVANRDGDASAFATNTAKIANNTLAKCVASNRLPAAAIQELEAVRIYLNRIQLALTHLDGVDFPTLATLEAQDNALHID